MKWSKEDINKLQDNFENKVDIAIKDFLAADITFAPKLEPLENGRPIYTRDYSYSVMNAALCVFINKEESKYDYVTKELIANCDMYSASKHLRDDCDSFYWATGLLCSIVEMFGSDGSISPGTLTTEAEKSIYEMMWIWVYDNALIEDAEYKICKTWHVWNSENHHIQKFSTIWHFLKLLLTHNLYGKQTLKDRHTVGEHFTAWNEYSKEWIRERGRRGLFVESGTGNYSNDTLKGIYNYLEYSKDKELQTLSKQLLDLYWAGWAIESLGGVRGGGKSRAYPNLHLSGQDHMRRLAWYYLGIGSPQPIKGNDLTYMLNHYRIPTLIMSLAHNVEERGDYEVRNRVMGLAKDGCYQPLNYRLADEGGVLRYTYCTPDFIMGSLLVEARPEPDWTMISSQNRWQGIIFPDDVDARIHVQCEAEREPYGASRPQSSGGIMRSYNQHWTLQSKGSMITQKLKTSLAAKEMQVWFAQITLDGMVEHSGWVFTRTQSAFCGVYIVSGGYTWKENKDGVPGKWLVLDNEWSPIIIEAVKSDNYKSFEAFMNACIGNELIEKDGVIEYRSLYHEYLTFYQDYSKLYEVNGIPVNINHDYSFDSPFVTGQWKSGEITIRFQDEKIKQHY